jgi:hypothetical protein
MESHRRIMIVSALAVAIALPVLVPAAALADSLLSGYGGPGAGNQVLIGSALLNGPGGGGGGGPSGPPGESSGSSRGGERVGAGGSSSTAVESGRRGEQVRDGTSRSRRTEGGESPGGAPRAYRTSSFGRASDASAGESETLGLSGGDLLYILLALAGLTLTTILTRRLTHMTATGGRRR